MDVKLFYVSPCGTTQIFINTQIIDSFHLTPTLRNHTHQCRILSNTHKPETYRVNLTSSEGNSMFIAISLSAHSYACLSVVCVPVFALNTYGSTFRFPFWYHQLEPSKEPSFFLRSKPPAISHCIANWYRFATAGMMASSRRGEETIKDYLGLGAHTFCSL